MKCECCKLNRDIFRINMVRSIFHNKPVVSNLNDWIYGVCDFCNGKKDIIDMYDKYEVCYCERKECFE